MWRPETQLVGSDRPARRDAAGRHLDLFEEAPRRGARETPDDLQRPLLLVSDVVDRAEKDVGVGLAPLILPGVTHG